MKFAFSYLYFKTNWSTEEDKRPTILLYQILCNPYLFYWLQVVLEFESRKNRTIEIRCPGKSVPITRCIVLTPAPVHNSR